MKWFLSKHRPPKGSQKKPEVNSAKTNSCVDEPTRPRNNSEKAATSVKTEDLWEKARQKLVQDKKLATILEQAEAIVEQRIGKDPALKSDTNGTVDLQKLHSSLETKVEELKQKRSVVRINDDDIEVREQLTRVIDNVLKFKDVITQAASLSPPVAILWAGLTVSLLLFTRSVKQEKSLLDGLETIPRLVTRLRTMEDSLLHPGASMPTDLLEKFKDTLVSSYCEVLEFQSRALCLLQKNKIRRTAKNMFTENWDDLIQSMKSHEEEAFNFNNLISQLQQKERSRNEKANQFIKDLYTCQYVDHKSRIDERVPRTCEWFTKHVRFQNWNQAKTSSLLWVSADPGCGKSVLSKYLVDQVLLNTKERTICYFFFRDDFDVQRSSKTAMASVLHQLFLTQRRLLSDSVLEQYDGVAGNKLAESFTSLWDLFKSITSSPDSGEIICVLDALDECEAKDRKQLLEAIKELYLVENKTRNVKFLLTSRPYDSIRQLFQPLEDQMPTIHLSGESEEECEKISREIDLVITKRVQDLSDKKRLERDEQEFLRKRLMVAEKKHRTYLWVTLTLDYIGELDGFTKGSVRNIEHFIPETVDEAYDKILSKSKDPARARRLLHIILAAKCPLTVEEVCFAMAMKGENQTSQDIIESTEPAQRFKDTLRNICGLMLVIVDNKVYFLHQTVKNYLVQNPLDLGHLESQAKWKHAFPVTMSSKVLAEICAWYISAASIDGSLDVLLHYSAVNWISHFSEALLEPHDEIVTLAYRLCDPRSKLYNTWIHANFGLTPFPSYHSIYADSSSFFIAAFFGIDVVVQKSIDGGDIKPSELEASLWFATDHGNLGVIRILLETGKVNCNIENETGQNLISLAAQRGHVNVIKLLLQHEPTDIMSKGNAGLNPLFHAARYGYVDVIKLLLEHETTNIMSKDKRGRSPLSHAAQRGHVDAVKLLLQHEMTDIMSKDKRGRSPLFLAAKAGYENTVRCLVELGKADVESKDNNGQSPLSIAAGWGRTATVKYFLGTGKADVESRDQRGRTPLAHAARHGREAVVKLLLETGNADVDSKNYLGETPLVLANEGQHKAVVRLLEDWTMGRRREHTTS